MNYKLLRVSDLTKDQKAAIATVSILQPPIPDGHLYVYSDDVDRCSKWYASRCTSLACRLVRCMLHFLDELCSGEFWRSLKKEHKATALFYLCVLALCIFVGSSLFRKKDANSKDFFEAVGTLALFFGAFWTATGVILSARETRKLVPPGDAKLNHDETVSILVSAARTASNRAWGGVILLLVGTVCILIKIMVAGDH